MGGVTIIISLLALFIMGLPVAFSMGLSSVVTMVTSSGMRWATVLQQQINGIATFTVLAIPLLREPLETHVFKCAIFKAPQFLKNRPPQGNLV